MRCEEIPGIDASFQPFFDPAFVGDSVACLSEDAAMTSSLSHHFPKTSYINRGEAEHL